MHQRIYFVHVSLLLLASFNAICFHWDVYVWTSASAGPNRAVYFGINVICGLPRVPADPLIWEFSSTRTILSRWAKGRHNRNDSVSFYSCVFVYTENCVVVTTCRSVQISFMKIVLLSFLTFMLFQTFMNFCPKHKRWDLICLAARFHTMKVNGDQALSKYKTSLNSVCAQ